MKHKAGKRPQVELNNLIRIAVIMLLIVSVCIQGGFFPVCIALVGILECILLAFIKEIHIDVKCLCLLTAFNVWYILCSVKNGFVIEDCAQAMLPVVVLLFLIIITSLKRDTITNILYMVVKLSICIAGISIICCIVSTIQNHTVERALFPFQYSNACGIYFAVMIMLSRKFNMKYGKIIFYIALILTQSIGALLLIIAAELIYSPNKRTIILVLAGAVVFALIFHNRVQQSIGTFEERLLQMYDGFLCVKNNPIFGIGAGRWAEARHIYQTGFYDATLIHSSIMQIAVDSGLIGLMLFAIIILYYLRKVSFVDRDNRLYLICVGMLLMHSCVDISMSFLGLDLLLVLITRCMLEDSEGKAYIGRIRIIPVSAILLSIFIVLEYGLIYAKTLNRSFDNGRYDKVITEYEKNPLIQKSLDVQMTYLKALYSVGDYDATADAIKHSNNITTDMYILKSWCENDYNILIDVLKEQKYNKKIYEELKSANDIDIESKLNAIYTESVASMSPIGKILYKKEEELK